MTFCARHVRANALPRLLFALVVVLACGCDRNGSGAQDVEETVSTEASDEEAVVPPRPVTFAPTPAAPKPVGPLPADASCVTAECHATMANAAFIHGPVAQGSCESCHQEDAGGHFYPLKATGTDGCTSCHSVIGTAEHQHAAMKDGCGACHDPHVASAKFLLKAGSIEATCAACHDVPLKAFAHEPFARGDCTVCHQPHQSEARGLLRGGEGPDHCFSCHTDLGAAIATSSHVHDPARGECATCHGPHATDFAFLLKTDMDETCFRCHAQVRDEIAAAPVAHGAMYEKGRCANCHDGHASQQTELLNDRMDRVCLSCHDKPLPADNGQRTIAGMATVLTKSQFLHGPIRSGDCSECHSAHGGTNQNLLVRAFPDSFYARFDIEDYALCFTCHEQDIVLVEKTPSLTNFRDGETNLHYAHVNRSPKGRTCRTCHSIHGSNLPNHMASEVPFEGSDWALPIEYEKTAEGGSCASGCHKPRSYTRTGPAVAPVTRRGEQ